MRPATLLLAAGLWSLVAGPAFAANKEAALAQLAQGNELGKKGNFDAAVAAYEKAIETDPSTVYAYSNLGYVYEEKGDEDKAIQYFLKAAELAPGDSIAWYDLGSAYVKKGDNAKALDSFERSFKLDPEFYKACMSLALAYEDGSKLDKASEYYVKAMSLTDDPEIKAAIMRQVSRQTPEKV